MAKLSRVLQKIFGSTGGGSEFGQIGSLAAGSPAYSKDLDTIQSLTQYLEGWFALTNSGAQPPRIQDANSLDLLITSQLKYLFQAGVPEWITTEEYYIGSICQVAGVEYVSQTGTSGSPNTGHDPTSDTTNWRIKSSMSLPIGTVLAFDGAWTDNVTMPGWYACISANAGLGCPDLVDRFILGKAIAGSGATGGSNTHTIAAAELPPHTHDLGSHTHSLSNHTHDMVMGAHSHNYYLVVFSNAPVAGSGTPASYVPSAAPVTATTSTDLGTKTSGGPSNNTSGAASGNTGNGGFANSAIDMHPAYYSMVYVKRVS
jgi:hypothetical protein